MRKFNRIIAAIMAIALAVSFCCISASAEEAAPVFGDATGDNEINIIDLVRLKKHTLGTGEVKEVYLVDADYNGELDAADLITMKKVLLGIEEYSTTTALVVSENTNDIPTAKW